MINAYSSKTVRYFCTVFIFTWVFWVIAIFLSRSDNDNGMSTLFLLLGLVMPTAITLVMIFTSKNAELKQDFKEKLFGITRMRPLNIILSIILIGAIIVCSILLSLLFGQSTDQFSFIDGFTFTIGGVSTLLTIILTALLEEVGWRGYAQDALASHFSWIKATIIFGIVWALWHLPLFFIQDTYQYEILQLNPLYMVNFFVGIPPIAILFTWVYVKNNRSIFACMFFHFFVNLLQEKVAMTQTTKCVETIVFYVVAVIIVLANRKMFFDKSHIEVREKQAQ